MAKKTLFMILLGLLCQLAPAQNFTLSGNVVDGETGEDLIGASVGVRETSTGAFTNQYGFFSLTMPPGEYVIEISYLGYQSLQFPLSLKEDVRQKFELLPSSTQIEAVEITGEVENGNVADTRIGMEKLDLQEIESIPMLFGERDVMKTVQMLPGVKRGGDGSAGFFVRGGGLDQNLILLDEAPVYNPSHMLGFFSVFNSDALKDVTLYKGSIPAEYGGRASSVMDIRMKEGNNKKFGVSGGIGLISSRLAVEGPIVKDKGSFIVSARRTYADLFLKLSGDEGLKSTQLYFYDLNAKANYRFGEKDRVFLSGYLGRDKFGFSELFGIDWGNKTSTLRWNHLFSDKLFSNTSLVFSDYSYAFGFGTDEDEVRLESFIRDWNFKQDLTWYPNSKNTLKAGGNLIHHTFRTGNLVAGENSGLQSSEPNDRYALEGAVYLQNEQALSPRLSLNYGLRYSFFNQIGPDTAYTFDDAGAVTSSTAYGDWESMQFYHGLEPRASLRYTLDEQSSIKAGYNRNYQYLHLLSNATSGTPTDLWIPSSTNVKPQYADQVSAGYFRNFSQGMYETSVETYFKSMQQLVDYKTGADIFLNSTIESELIFGSGKAYGVEFLVKKKKGRFTGWVSYTLSRTLRNFDDVDNGATYPARQDRIHDLAIVAMYSVSDRVKLSANWVFNTGDAATFPSGSYEYEGVEVPYYTERNGYRMPDYHRLDLGLTIKGKTREKYASEWNFSLYNAYGRQNAYQITFQPDPDNPSQNQAVKLALFRWIPSISYNFNF